MEVKGSMLEKELKHSWSDWYIEESVGSLCWETTTAWGALCITFRRLDFIPRTIQVDEWRLVAEKEQTGGAGRGASRMRGIREPYQNHTLLQGLETAQNQFRFPCCLDHLPHPFFPFTYIPSGSLSGKKDEVKTFMLFMITWPARFPHAQTKRYTASQKEKVMLPETLPPSCSQALLYKFSLFLKLF